MNYSDQPIKASASSDAERRIKEGKNTNIQVYLLSVEDHEKKNKSTYFLSSRQIVLDNPNYVDFYGFELTDKKDIKALNSLSNNDILEYVKENNITVKNIKFPWTKINKIENLTYKNKA